MDKKENASRRGLAAFDGANFPDKDRNISIETGLSIKKWIKKHPIHTGNLVVLST